MKVVAYCRVSTKKEDQLNSLEAQKRFFEEHASNNPGYELIKIYADEGLSGTKTKNRKQFNQMMADALKGAFDIILVKDISRFARNTVDSLTNIRALKEHNVKLLFLSYNSTVLAGESEFMITLMSAMAQEESATISFKVKNGKKSNAKNGRVPNFVFGYDKTPRDYFNLAINETEANTVRRIFNMYVNAGCGANKIALILNSEGAKTKRGSKWSQTAVARILTNELYIGKIVNGKDEVVNFLTGKRKKKDEIDWYITDKPELKIIDEETFIEAQKTLKERHDAFNLTGKRNSTKHIFSTLIKCKCCGWSFRRTERTHVNTFIRWVCSGRNSNGVASCPNKTVIDEAELLAGIKGYLIAVLGNKQDILKRIKKEYERINGAKNTEKKTEVELEDELKKIQHDKGKYLEMFKAEVITMLELKEYTKPLNDRMEFIEKELNMIKANITDGDQINYMVNNLFKEIESVLDTGYMTNEMLQKVIKISVDDDGIVDIKLNLENQEGPEETVLLSSISS